MKELDPLLHSQLRLAVMSILLNVEEADFNYIKEKTESTSGNLSVQLDKLVTAGVSVSAMQPFFNHYACYLCSNIIKTSKLC